MYCPAVLPTGVKEHGVCGEVCNFSTREAESFVGPEDGRVVQLLAGIELGQRAGLVQERHT